MSKDKKMVTVRRSDLLLGGNVVCFADVVAGDLAHVIPRNHQFPHLQIRVARVSHTAAKIRLCCAGLFELRLG